MKSALDQVPLPPMEHVSQAQNVQQKEEVQMEHVLWGLESAVLFTPQPVAPPSQQTPHTSETQTTPAPTLPPPQAPAPSPSTRCLQMSVN